MLTPEFAALILALLGPFAGADAPNDAATKISTEVCAKTMADKTASPDNAGLKLKGSKLEPVCAMTARTAFGNCTTETVKVYRPSVASAEKPKVDRTVAAGTAFCSAYADMVSTDIVDQVIVLAKKDKSSIDAATAKLVRDALAK